MGNVKAPHHKFKIGDLALFIPASQTEDDIKHRMAVVTIISGPYTDKRTRYEVTWESKGTAYTGKILVEALHYIGQSDPDE